MIYKNPKYKKMKNSRILFILCGHCKSEIVKYQKVGKGNLLKMHIERVISASIDFSKEPKALHCLIAMSIWQRELHLREETKKSIE